jgi:hypothetical protein
VEQGYNIQEQRVFILDTAEDTNCWSRCPQKISGVLDSTGITSNRKTLYFCCKRHQNAYSKLH